MSLAGESDDEIVEFVDYEYFDELPPTEVVGESVIPDVMIPNMASDEKVDISIADRSYVEEDEMLDSRLHDAYKGIIEVEPIKRITEPLTEQNRDIPGHVEADISGRLLKTMLVYDGLANNNIRGYDHFVLKRLPLLLASRTLTAGDKIIQFVNPIFIRPHISTNDSGKTGDTIKHIFPPEAEEMGINYSATLKADAIIKDRKTGEQVGIVKHFHIGLFPVMLGSALCNSRGLNDHELLKIFMDPKDPLGYFIIQGASKVVLIQEQLRVNDLNIYYAENIGTVVARMTLDTVLGSHVVQLQHEEKNGIIKFKYGSDDKKNVINALIPFKLLGELINGGQPLTTTQMFNSLIKPFIRPEQYRTVWLKLQNTFADLATIADPIEYLTKHKVMKNMEQWRNLKQQLDREDTGDDFQGFGDEEDAAEGILGAMLQGLNLGGGKKRQKNIASAASMKTLTNDEKKELLQKDLIRVLFPQLNNEENRVTKKLYMLGMMIARFGQYLGGVRPLDDRDDWGNKRLEGAGRSMEKLFRGLWSREMTDLQQKLNKQGANAKIEDVIRGFNSHTFTKIFSDSFSGSHWGLRRADQNSVNMVESMKRASLAEGAAYITKINTPTPKEMKKASVRMVQPSQLGYVCPVETPEGVSCGLVKHLSISCRLSINHGAGDVRRIIDENNLVSYNNRTLIGQAICMMNGILLGWCDGELTRNILINARRSGNIPVDVCIYYNNKSDELIIFTNSSRPTRPLLIAEIDPVTKRSRLVIDKKNMWEASYEDLLKEGVIEYVDALEQRGLFISTSIESFNDFFNVSEVQRRLNEAEALKTIVLKNRDDVMATTTAIMNQRSDILVSFDSWKEYKDYVDNEISVTRAVLENVIRRGGYTHCELDPTAVLGISANLIPLLNHNQGPRNIYQASMGKQALGVVHSAISQRMDNIKALNYPTRPYFATQAAKWIGMDELPAGNNVTIAFMSYSGYNQEDAIYVSKEFIDNGGFRYTVYHVYKSDNYNSSSSVEEVFAMPPLRPGEDPSIYHAIDENGLPRIEATVNSKDCIIGKVRRTESNGEITERNVSTFLPVGIEGRVERVVISSEGGQTLVKVKIRQTRIPGRGDKLASRHAQKSTIGQVVSKIDLPFDATTGVTPDIIINEKCVPSRMTIAMLIEILLSTGATMLDERINATAFRKITQDGGVLEDLQRVLREYGFDDMGYVSMRSGITGEMFKTRIFTGPVYYQVLKHLVQFKYQARGGTGPNSILTRQPVPGRVRGGGGRFGEMEVWALIGHGSSALLQDKLCFSSDPYKDVYCTKCGNQATLRSRDEQYICFSCGTQANENLGTCTIPYGMQVYINTLQAAGMKVQYNMVPKTSELDV